MAHSGPQERPSIPTETEAGRPANPDMVEGYRDGFRDHRDDYPAASNRSASYAHGWLNGRDDRKGNPRAGAGELRRLAELAMLADDLA